MGVAAGNKKDQSLSLLSTTNNNSIEFNSRSRGANKIPMFSPVGSVHQNVLLKYSSFLEDTPGIKVEGNFNREVDIIED